VIDVALLRDAFRAEHGAEPRVFSAPGRVNLIGEHTDYNDGFVLPMAIDRRTYVAARARADRVVRVRSRNLGESPEIDLDRPGPKKRGHFVDYVEGTARALEDKGVRLVGANLLIESDVPTGAGLSSSAELELSVGLALATLAGRPTLNRIELALAGQRAEHDYVGTICGIMDQYIAALGQADHALLIDCRSLEPTAVPLTLPGLAMVICDTQVKHELSSSEYNKRRAECHEGVAILHRGLPDVRALRDVSSEMLRAHEAELPEVVGRRCRHVVTENERTTAAAQALGKNDWESFGKLMVLSHRSLRDDYEVSSPELDVCVEAALGQRGVKGARMTGGGFGGSTVNLVEQGEVPAVEEAITRAYERKLGRRPVFFVSRACEGAKEEA
jgi:galactokinase